MSKKIANGDLVFQATGECGDIAKDGCVEVDFFLVVEHHDRGGRSDDFAERSDVIDGVFGIDGRAGGAPGEMAKAAFPDSGALATDDDRGAGVATGLDASLDDSVYRLEPLGGHANCVRCLRGQTVAGSDERKRGHDDLQHIQLLLY